MFAVAFRGSPPRMRGKVLLRFIIVQPFGITPAYAGKRYTRCFACPRPTDYPRVCGEKARQSRPTAWVRGSPPRMRGKVQLQPGQPAALGITPAYAGKSQTAGCRTAAPEDHPRVCGEKTSSNVPERKNPGSPPRMQGKGCPLLFRYYFIGITPACAGKSSWCGSHPPASGDHPRVCGEKVIQVVPPAPQVGSPPRVRGKVTPHHRVANDRGITPACAGKRRTTRTSGARYRDHPRVCGEKKKCYTKGGILPGSPPRVRGKDAPTGISSASARITPACAGKSMLRFVVRMMGRDHPRVCGEKRWKRRTSSCMAGSPPRVRGKARRLQSVIDDLPIPPACAGKSKTRRVQWPVGLDHPRVCGEKRPDRQLTGWPLGSPPRVRGKVDCSAQLWPLYGITPAYAGKSFIPLRTRCRGEDHPRVCGEKLYADLLRV